MSTVTEFSSLPILAGYLTICATLTLIKCVDICRRYLVQKKQNPQGQRPRTFFVFLLLTILSLSATWYHMFSFFNHSYVSWAMQQSDPISLQNQPVVDRLELWLRDTKLFREAWESVSESPLRFWWSGQIFLFTVGWSLVLGVQGRRHNIPAIWMFMLIGQIVAISFAQNLFILTLLVSPPSHATSTNGNNQGTNNDKNTHETTIWNPPALLELTPIVLSLTSAAVVPSVAHTALFMPVLLIPHILLFIPCLLSPRALSRLGLGAYRRADRYDRLYKLVAACAVLIQARSTYLVAQSEGLGLGLGDLAVLGRRLVQTIGEHPAVSSVGWDAVFCSVTLFCYSFLF